MILGIIFDFDNTLYDYDNANNNSLNCLFNTISVNHNIKLDDIINIYKIINNNIKNSNNNNNKFNKSIYIKILLEELNIPLKYIDEYIKLYFNEFDKNIILYEGVLDLFQFLKDNKIKIGICTNNIFKQQYDKLIKNGLIEYVDVIQTSDEIGEEKPNINIFLNIQFKLKIPFENLVYIGDNIKHDIIPSLKLNMLPFHYINNINNIKLNNNYFQFSNYNDLLLFFKNYLKTTNELLFLSKCFGQSILNIQGQGGNISVKMDDIIFIKSSGAILGNLSYNEGYCIANNLQVLDLLKQNKEQELKYTKIFGYKIPSMETFFHAFMKKYTVHIHFALSNVFFCSNNINNEDIMKNFTYKYKIIKYIPPGLLLGNEIYNVYDDTINIYFLENHGLILTNDNIDILNDIYLYIFDYFNKLLDKQYTNELTAFNINNIYFKKTNKTVVIREYKNMNVDDIINIKYCFPDLVIFIDTIGIFNNINDYTDNLNYNLNYDIIIINKSIYICAINLTKIYNLIENLDIYNILIKHSYNNLNEIPNIKYLKNMEQEKFRKI